MFRNVHNPSGSTPQARNAAARRRTVFIALVLALVIGGAGQPVLAQGDGPRGTRIVVSMVARQLQAGTICVNDQVEIAVNVYERVESVTLGPVELDFIGVEVQAQVGNSSIGEINPPSNLTRVDREGRASFVFTAKEPGTTLIQFRGKVNALLFLGFEIFSGDTVSDVAQVTVEECLYRVIANSKFFGRGNTLRAGMDGALKRDADGRLTGVGSVVWFGGVFSVGDCRGPFGVANSEAELTGKLDDKQLIVTMAYLPAAFTGTLNCSGGGSQPIQARVRPDSVTFIVPASGGSEVQFQDFYEPIFQFQGDVKIYVSRVK